MSKVFVLTLCLLAPIYFASAQAQVKSYESTDNTGINKKEQIEVIEKYLADLSGTLKTMEAKLDANTIKLKALEDVVKAIKEQDLKKIQDQIGEKKEASTSGTPEAKPNTEELDKIKADILAIKNEDIEKVQFEVRALNSSIEQIQQILKINRK